MEAGSMASAEITTQDQDMAKALSSADTDFPEVFATSRMIALMELAAARCMKGLVKPGELSVGVNINVNHLAATPKGVLVRAEATYTGMQGKLFGFEVAAFDQGGLIGKGTHTRAVISTERLVSGALSRNRGQSAG
ncbi:MAG: thioesterase [Acidimicrobiia bacterium]|nr:thioesterase [Acidimicrobiia bacterium]